MDKIVANAINHLLNVIASAPLYDQVTALNNVALAIEENTDALDHPDLDAFVQEVVGVTQDWMDENEPSEAEEEARQVLASAGIF